MPVTNHPESEEKKVESKGKSSFFRSKSKEEKSDKPFSRRHYRVKDTFRPKEYGKLEEGVQVTKDGKLEVEDQPQSMQLPTIPFDISKTNKKRFSSPILPSVKVNFPATFAKESRPILPPIYPVSTKRMMERIAQLENEKEVPPTKRRKTEDTVTRTFAAKDDKFNIINQLILKPKDSSFRRDSNIYREILDSMDLRPLNNSFQEDDFIQKARDVLGAVSLNQNNYHIFDSTKVARDAVTIFLKAFYGRAECDKVLYDYNRKDRGNVKADPCISAALTELKYKGQDYNFCLLSVSSLGKDLHNKSGLWDLLAATAQDLNNAILSGQKRGSTANETFFQVIDMSSRELNDLLGGITKELVSVPKGYNPQATCSEKPAIDTLGKLFCALGPNVLRIKGWVNLSFKKEPNIGKYFPEDIVIGNEKLKQKGLCFNCDTGRFGQIKWLVDAATNQGPRLSFPSPLRSAGPNSKTISLIEALVDAVYEDRHSPETSLIESKGRMEESSSCKNAGHKKFEMELGASYNDDLEEREIAETNTGVFGR